MRRHSRAQETESRAGGAIHSRPIHLTRSPALLPFMAECVEFKRPTFKSLVVELFPHPDAVKEWPGTDGVGVRESGRARLSNDVGGERNERWLGSQVGAALKKIIQADHALPAHYHARRTGDGAEQAQHGKGVAVAGSEQLISTRRDIARATGGRSELRHA